MVSPMFQRAAQAAKPTPAPTLAVTVPEQFQPARPAGIVPQGLFAGISKAKPRQGGGFPWVQPGHYFARIDQMKFGVTDGSKGPRASYIVVEMTAMASFEDKEGKSIPAGGQMQAYYSNARYPESFLADIKGLLMAYFSVDNDAAAKIPDGDWESTIAEACQPEQILKGAVLELRVYMNRKQTFTKTEWVRRVSYTELDKIMPRDETRTRILPDEELQKQIAKETA